MLDVLKSSSDTISDHILAYSDYEPEGTREATGRGGGNERESNQILCKNRPMSQVQTLKLKLCKNLMNTPTNNVEMIP
jgi:hypothetical protein